MEVLKIRILQIVIMVIALFLSLILNAQTAIDSKLKKLFFNLNIDSCQTKIEKEIENSKEYKFKFIGDIDTLNAGNFKIYSKSFSIFSCYKLEYNAQSLVNCDSTLILLQPALVGKGVSHGKVDFEKLYGHRVSILMYFSDSIRAYKTYRNFVDSISNNLERESWSGDFTIDDVVIGNSTTINIDKKNNGYEYQRDLEISIRRYEKLYELNVDFVRLTISLENCENE
ncbi:MAG TPA: hypothetical protein VI731_07920 [Bacteroidia bacterium]|nr:hypothetical protein [Bacteroidia bacterium]